jgi:iron(III) transport system substrate-binding protein
MKPPVSRRIALLAILTLVLGACGSESSESGTDERTDRTMVLYSGRSEDLVAPLVEQFEEASGITVEVRYAGSGEMATTLVQEGDQTPADAFWSQDPAFAGAVALEGLFRPLPEDILEQVDARFSDSEGRWVGVTARSRVLVYNPDLVDSPPANVWELTDPRWRGRLGVAPTNGSFVAFVSAMTLTEGADRTLEWLRGIEANDPVIFDGNSPIVEAVDAGDVDAGLVNHYYLLRLADERGGATAMNHFFADGDPGALVMPSGIGVIDGADHEEEALELVRFLLGAEAQTYFLETVFEYPLDTEVGTPTGQTALDELPTLDIDPSELATTVDQATDLIAEAGLT